MGSPWIMRVWGWCRRRSRIAAARTSSPKPVLPRRHDLVRGDQETAALAPRDELKKRRAARFSNGRSWSFISSVLCPQIFFSAPALVHEDGDQYRGVPPNRSRLQWGSGRISESTLAPNSNERPRLGEPRTPSIVMHGMTFDPIALANEVPDAATFDRAVLDLLDRSLGFDAAFLAIQGEQATAVNVDSKKLDSAIARGDYADELAPMKAAALARRGVAVDTQVLGEQHVRALRYHRDFAAPIGGRHSLLAFLTVRGVPTGASC